MLQRTNTFYNRYDASASDFTTFGKVVVLDLEKGDQTLISKELFNTSNRYVSPNKGTIIVLDTRTNKHTQITMVEFNNNNDFYIGSLKNKVVAISKKTNLKQLVSKEDFYSDDDLVGMTTNTVVVTDTRNNTTMRVPTQEFKNNDFYVSLVKDKVNVVDTRTNKNTQVSKDDFNKYDHYISCIKAKPVAVYDKTQKKNILISNEEFSKGNHSGLNKDLIPVKDLRNGTTVLINREDFIKHEYYAHTSCKTFKIYDQYGTIKHTVTTGFASFCKKYKLPLRALEKSYLSNGEPIYQKPTSMLTKNGNIKYKGWYAIKED